MPSKGTRRKQATFPSRTNGTLRLPALRAQIGDWVYYISFLPFKEVAARVRVAQDIHQAKTLNELIQRALTPRAEKIADYLLEQQQRFFNSLVIAVYGGAPQWYELGITENQYFEESDLPLSLEGALGLLMLNGKETLFALDGQHRVEGIKKAIIRSPELQDEEVSTLFVGHTNDKPGLERTRRLFTTLNRYAKPVSKHEIIALDEDDAIAITTRQLVREHPLFAEKVSTAKGKNIPPGDKRSFTTIVALYDVLDIILRTKVKGWVQFKAFRPSDVILTEFSRRAISFWEAMAEYFPAVHEMMEKTANSRIASRHRSADGGHLLFRPIGLITIARVVRDLLDQGEDLLTAIAQVAKVPMQLNKYPWAGLFWDTYNARMITSSEAQKSARKMLYYALTGSLGKFKIEPRDLQEELAGVMNKDPEDIKLLRL